MRSPRSGCLIPAHKPPQNSWVLQRALAGQAMVHPRKSSLRVRTRPVPATITHMTTRKQIITSQQRKEDEMHALALELGFFCTPSVTYRVTLATAIAASMRPRSGSMVYQCAAISLPNFPLELARQTFAFATQDLSTPAGTTTWTIPTMDHTMQVFGSIFLDAGPSCSGASKVLKTASEPVVRVLATIMPGAVISHVVPRAQARHLEKLCASCRLNPDPTLSCTCAHA